MKNLWYYLMCLVLVTGPSLARELNEVLVGTARIETFAESGSRMGSGSGFVVGAGGLIITNHHVLEGASSVLLTMASGRTFRRITIEDFDEHKDLALIKVNADNLPALPLGNSASVSSGDEVWAMGNTLGEYSNSVSRGVISGIRRNDAGFRYLQFTASISPGNSGGPLLNKDLEAIGVATATRIDGQNVNFAIPINYVLGMLENRRNLSLRRYRQLAGKGSVSVIGRNRKTNLVHPDTDITRRVIITPLDVHTESGGTGREEIFQALVFRLKEMFPEEELVVVEASAVKSVMREFGRDIYDSLVRPLEPEELKQLAVRLRANSVISGTIHSFQHQYESMYLPYVGDLSGWRTKFNVDLSLYKLDRDEIVFETKVRESLGDSTVQVGSNMVASKFYTRLQQEFESFSATDLYGDRSVILKTVGEDYRLIPQDKQTADTSKEPSRKERLLEKLKRLSSKAK